MFINAVEPAPVLIQVCVCVCEVWSERTAGAHFKRMLQSNGSSVATANTRRFSTLQLLLLELTFDESPTEHQLSSNRLDSVRLFGVRNLVGSVEC